MIKHLIKLNQSSNSKNFRLLTKLKSTINQILIQNLFYYNNLYL